MELSRLVSGSRDIGRYFRALRKFESAVSFLYQGLDLARKALDQKLFTSGDGSPSERLNLLYNKSKHGNPAELPPGHLHVVWIKNEGLAADGCEVSFDELRGVIGVLARIADRLANGRVSTP